MTNLTAQHLAPYTHTQKNGTHTLLFMVGGIHCAACLHRIETAVGSTAGVTKARLNFTTKRLTLEWKGPPAIALAAVTAAEAAGYTLTPYNPTTLTHAAQAQQKMLLRCLAVAGFAGANIMLLSVSMWAGIMPESQRLLFQWLSALLALPAVAYAGRPYFTAAAQALRHGRMSMEVPISLAVLLTTALSLYDTLVARGETYFESAVMLLFFLLIGRTLESQVQGRSRNAAEQLLGAQHTLVTVVGKDGTLSQLPAAQVPLGAIVLWRQNEKLAVDGLLLSAAPAVETAALTGESLPRAFARGDGVQGGMVNIAEAVQVQATAVGQGTVMAELARLMEAATAAKNGYTRLADKVSRTYAPVVHGLAALTLGGGLLAGLPFHESLLRAVAVLIVTCPCALALAVPTVQVAVIGRLLRQGIIVKGGDALEKLASITHAVLDKTGTLTTGAPTLVGTLTAPMPSQRNLLLAARLAVLSQHPLAVALTRAAMSAGPVTPLKGATEVAGQGVRGSVKESGKTLQIRFGSAAFCGVKNAATLPPGHAVAYLRTGTQKAIPFIFEDTLRPHAKQALAQLQSLGLQVTLLSGDRPEAAQAMAAQAGLPQESVTGGATPKQKQALLTALQKDGAQVMMVGDGLNDAPSLAAAQVGVSFGQATDLAKLSADVILQQESLLALPELVRMGRLARRGYLTNFALSFAYNVLSIPLAMAGFITPLWAALLMSASSLVVVTNAARLGLGPILQKEV